MTSVNVAEKFQVYLGQSTDRESFSNEARSGRPQRNAKTSKGDLE
jgi:hypothetical protein